MKTSILPTMALALQVDWLDAYGQQAPYRVRKHQWQRRGH